MRPRANKRLIKVVVYTLLILGGVVIVFPFVWLVMTAFKPPSEIVSLPIKILPSRISFENFQDVMRRTPVFWNLLSGFIYAGAIAVAAVFFSTMVGYGLTKFRARAANLIFFIMLAGVMLPVFLIVIPLYLMMASVDLSDTYVGLILPMYLSVLGIFIMRQYTMSIPDELLDAARIDGASEFGILMRIVFPLVKPAWIALGILKFMLTWNDFLWPLIMLGTPKKMTLPVALTSLLAVERVQLYGPLMAGTIFLILPVIVLFTFFQRYIVAGIALTGFK